MSEAPTQTTASGAVMVSPSGRLDLVSAADLRRQLLNQIQSGNVRLIVDLSRIERIDSTGLSALVAGLKAARQAGGTLQIARPSKPVLALLKLTNLARVLECYEPADSVPKSE